MSYEAFGPAGPVPGSTPSPGNSEAVDYYSSLGFGTRPTAAFGEAPDGPLPGSPEYARMIHEAEQALEEEGQAPGDGQGEEAKAPVAEAKDYHTALAGAVGAAEVAEVGAAMKDLGLSPEQAQKLAKWHSDRQERQAQAFRAQSEAALRREWGAQYEANIGRAKESVDRLDRHLGGGLRELLAGGAGNDARVVKLIMRLGELI